MARSVHHWITSHSHSRKQSSQSMHFISTQKRCETTPKAAKYDLVLKQNMLPEMSCNNHNSKSYAVKRLSNWIEAGLKSWTSPSANRFGIFESYPKTRLQSKISAEKNRNSMPRGLRWAKSRKHAKISSEAAVQETTGDFDLKILTDHVDCSMNNANIAQGQIDLRCLQYADAQLPFRVWQIAKRACLMQASKFLVEHSTETQPEIQIPNRYS